MRFPLPKQEETMSQPQQITQLDRLERMLSAILQADNRLHWIGGYVYGRTSNDDPFIILYPAAPYLNNKICRVYPHDFKKLPSFIPTDEIPANTDANPDKDKAIKKGIFHACPMFQIVTYAGKDTQMGPEVRFGDVLIVTSKMPEGMETAVPANGTAPVAPPPPAAPPVTVDQRGAMSPQAQSERKPAKPQTPEWEFYEMVYQANKAVYPDAVGVSKIAALINSSWKFSKEDAINNAMSNALGTYARTRADLTTEKKVEARKAHTDALNKAVADFDKFLVNAVW